MLSPSGWNDTFVIIKIRTHCLPSIVHDIWKSAQAPKCLTVKSLKTKIVHTVTKGKRHNAGCACKEKIIQTETCECVSDRNIVTMDECFWINAPQWCAWPRKKKEGKKERKRKKRKNIGPCHFDFFFSRVVKRSTAKNILTSNVSILTVFCAV